MSLEIVNKNSSGQVLPSIPGSWQEFCEAFHLMPSLNHCMSSFITTNLKSSVAKNRTNFLARRFIASSCMFDSFVMKRKATCESMCSLLGLLCVPDVHNMGNCPICYCEGDDMGEGIVKSLRPLMWIGLRDGWTCNLLGMHCWEEVVSYFLINFIEWKPITMYLLVKTGLKSKFIAGFDACSATKNKLSTFSFAQCKHCSTGKKHLTLLFKCQTGEGGSWCAQSFKLISLGRKTGILLLSG